jgi:hypothetical protein
MASRPPENDNQARNRWLVIQMLRLGGVVFVLVALLALQGIIPIPDVAAYAILFVGLVDVFLVPTLLARAWSSRR